MPHIIMEYADCLMEKSQVETALNAIHRSIVQSGLFEQSHIKTRAYPFKVFTQAGTKEPYIHIQARIKSGRDAENKKRLSTQILEGLKPLSIPASVITVEIIDMDRESYGKYKLS